MKFGFGMVMVVGGRNDFRESLSKRSIRRGSYGIEIKKKVRNNKILIFKYY